MKKIKLVLVLSLVISVMASTGQMSVKAPVTVNRAAEYVCLPNSLVSQLPWPVEAGWLADDTYQYNSAADDYTVTASFTSMRFWGANPYSCPPGAVQEFTIKFYQRNIGDITIPGVEVYSFDLTAVPQPINFVFGGDYQIDVVFPEPVTLLDGWVSITRINPGDGCTFVWLGNYSGNSASYDSIIEMWVGSSGMLAFCLGGDEIPATPLSDWALYIGIILIGSFIIIRFRRLV